MADSTAEQLPQPPTLPDGKVWKTSWLKEEVLPYCNYLAKDDGFSKGTPLYEYITELQVEKGKLGSRSGVQAWFNNLRDAYEEQYGACDETIFQECLKKIKDDLGDASIGEDPYSKDLLEDLAEEFGATLNQKARNGLYRKGHPPVPKDNAFFIRIIESPWGKDQYDCFGERPEACKARNDESHAAAQKKMADGQKLVIPHDAGEIVNGIALKLCKSMEKNQSRDDVKDSVRLQLSATAVYLLSSYGMTGRPQDMAPGCAESGEEGVKASSSGDVFELDESERRIRFKCVKKTKQLKGSAHRATNWRVLMLPLHTFKRLVACLDHEWEFLVGHKFVKDRPDKWFSKPSTMKFAKSELWAPLREVAERRNGMKCEPYMMLKAISVALLPYRYSHELSPAGITELQKLQCGHYTSSSTQHYLLTKVKSTPGGTPPAPKLWVGFKGRDLIVSETPIAEGSLASSDDESSGEISPSADDDTDGGDEEEDEGEGEEESTTTSNSGDDDSNDGSAISTAEVPAAAAAAATATTAAAAAESDEPPAKRIKVHHRMMEMESYCNYLKGKEGEGYTLVYE